MGRTLILPGEQGAVDVMAGLSEIVWVRNPATGVIYRLHRDHQRDTVQRCLSEKPPYTLSTEQAAREQAIELARLQGRPLPPWAREEPAAEPGPAPAAVPEKRPAARGV